MPLNPYMSLQKTDLQECADLLRGECHAAKALPEQDLNVALDLFSGVGNSLAHCPDSIKKYLPSLNYFAENVRESSLAYENLLRSVLIAYEVFPKPEYPHRTTGDSTHDEVRARVFSWVLDNTQDESLVEEISKVFTLPTFCVQAAVFTSCENMNFMLCSGRGEHFRADNVAYYSEKARKEAVMLLRHLIQTA